MRELFVRRLIEDRSETAYSYVEFLKHIRKEIPPRRWIVLVDILVLITYSDVLHISLFIINTSLNYAIVWFHCSSLGGCISFFFCLKVILTFAHYGAIWNWVKSYDNILWNRVRQSSTILLYILTILICAMCLFRVYFRENKRFHSEFVTFGFTFNASCLCGL
jgi:hypothetical protein